MNQRRNTPRPRIVSGLDLSLIPGGDRPLSARSVVASTLLGADPPRLPGRLLVRAAGLFGISEGTTRVALSRMVAAGELEADDGHYRLTGPLLDRQARQAASRRAEHHAWNGDWFVAIAVGDRRDAPARSALRDAARRLKLAPLREGVWVRPDNLDHGQTPSAAVLDTQCRCFVGDPIGGPLSAWAARPATTGADPQADRPEAAALAASLWDLPGWAATARELQTGLDRASGRLDGGDPDGLAPAFVLSAAVLRHLLADPLLPDELLAVDWPGAVLRRDYDRYDRVFKRAWRAWFASLT